MHISGAWPCCDSNVRRTRFWLCRPVQERTRPGASPRDRTSTPAAARSTQQQCPGGTRICLSARCASARATANIRRVCLVTPPQTARRAAPQRRCRMEQSNRNAVLGPAICIRLTERGCLDIEPAPYLYRDSHISAWYSIPLPPQSFNPTLAGAHRSAVSG